MEWFGEGTRQADCVANRVVEIAAVGEVDGLSECFEFVATVEERGERSVDLGSPSGIAGRSVDDRYESVGRNTEGSYGTEISAQGMDSLG